MDINLIGDMAMQRRDFSQARLWFQGCLSVLILAGFLSGCADTDKVRVTSVTPAEDAVEVDTGCVVKASFNYRMDADTINSASFVLEQEGVPVPGVVAYDIETRTAIFTPDTSLAQGCTYTARVTRAVTNIIGRPLATEKVWCFTTLSSADTTAPGQVSLSTVVADNGRVDVQWSNPTDADFDHVLVAWTPDGSAGQVISAPDAACSLTGLDNYTDYTFTLTSVDVEGNASAPVSFSATPTLSGPVTYHSLYTAADLDAVRGALDGHYLLMADVDLSPAYGGGWQPIGTDGDPFLGSLDGNNHVITGLFIDSGADDSGLFGYIGEGSSVKNVGIENCDVTGGNFTGSLVGYNYRGTIVNCHASGLVTSAAGVFVGGLVGINSQGPITSCYSTVDVSGYQVVGGLVGRNNNANIIDCYAIGNVTGAGGYVGGLLGYSNTHTLANCFATGNVTGSTNVGGLAGYLTWVTASNCYAAGAVSGSSVSGGLVGIISDTTITHCYYDEDISGQNDTGKGESRTTAQMTLIDASVPTYEGWDFSAIWDYSDGYPFLRSNPLP